MEWTRNRRLALALGFAFGGMLIWWVTSPSVYGWEERADIPWYDYYGTTAISLEEWNAIEGLTNGCYLRAEHYTEGCPAGVVVRAGYPDTGYGPAYCWREYDAPVKCLEPILIRQGVEEDGVVDKQKQSDAWMIRMFTSFVTFLPAFMMLTGWVWEGPPTAKRIHR
jgi:hypothetical protein